MIPATPFVEFSGAPSPRHRLLLGLFHGLVLIILLLANLPLLQMVALAVVVTGLYLWRRRVLAQRSVWRLRFELDSWYLDKGNGGQVPVTCEVHYLSRWLVVLSLDTKEVNKNPCQFALFSDGMNVDDWRLLHVIAREMLRKAQGRLTIMS